MEDPSDEMERSGSGSGSDSDSAGGYSPGSGNESEQDRGTGMYYQQELFVGARIAAEGLWGRMRWGWGVGSLNVEFHNSESAEDIQLLTETLESCDPEPRAITIHDSAFDEVDDPARSVDDEARAADHESNESWGRFFRDVLPRLVLAVTFQNCDIAPLHLREFATACSSPPLVLSRRILARLRNVILREIKFDQAQLDALSLILSPAPNEMGILALHFDQCQLPDGQCDVIWDRLRDNRHLRAILFTRNNLRELGDRALRSINSSKLKRLAVVEPGLRDVEGVQLAVANALRRNEHLISVAAVGDPNRKASRAVMNAFEDMVRTCTCDLDTIQLEQHLSHGPEPPADGRTRLGRLVSANVGLRPAMGQLRERDYAVSSISILPRVIKHVGPKPTMIFRLLRRANVRAICDALAAAVQHGSPLQGRQTLRRRRRRDQPPAVPSSAPSKPSGRPVRKRR